MKNKYQKKQQKSKQLKKQKKWKNYADAHHASERTQTMPYHVDGGMYYCKPYWFEKEYKAPQGWKRRTKRTTSLHNEEKTVAEPKSKQLMKAITVFLQNAVVENADEMNLTNMAYKVLYSKYTGRYHENEIGNFEIRDAKNQWIARTHLIQSGHMVTSIRKSDGKEYPLPLTVLTDEQGLSLVFDHYDFDEYIRIMARVKSNTIIGFINVCEEAGGNDN